MLLNAWAKKKDGSAFTSEDVFPEAVAEEQEDARADLEGQRTLAMFQSMAAEEQMRKGTAGG